MVFYTYIFYAGVNGNHNGFTDRHLLTSPNRDTADQLFRGIQENLPLNLGCSTITKLHRLGPQMWTWEGGPDDVYELITKINGGYARVKCLKYLGNLNCKTLPLQMYNGDGGIQPVIPSIHVPDHIDGKTFYIRPKLRPNYYWYVLGGNVRLSTEWKSQFRVSIQNTKVKDAVMVGLDSISITYVEEGGEYPVSIEPTGLLQIKRGRTESTDYFKFAAFEGGFDTIKGGLHVGLIWGKDDLTNERRGDEWELC